MNYSNSTFLLDIVKTAIAYNYFSLSVSIQKVSKEIKQNMKDVLFYNVDILYIKLLWIYMFTYPLYKLQNVNNLYLFILNKRVSLKIAGYF